MLRNLLPHQERTRRLQRGQIVLPFVDVVPHHFPLPAFPGSKSTLADLVVLGLYYAFEERGLALERGC